MGLILDQSGIANTLVGEWRIGASNLDSWVDGARRNPVFQFAIEQESPLILREEQVFTTADGKERRIVVMNRLVHDEFVSKSRRIAGTMNRWSVGGTDPDRGILIIRMIHPRGGQDGLIVLVRDSATIGELRTIIATDADSLGVGPEDFASLTWVPAD